MSTTHSPTLRSLEQVRALDAADPLRAFRDAFVFPVHSDGTPVVYLVGNSLGLLPKAARDAVLAELDAWGALGVDGHFSEHGHRAPWVRFHEQLSAPAAALVGAQPSEVVAMGSLTANLHMLLVSFYRPRADAGARRHKIVIEGGAFPSDRALARSQARVHGFDPDEAVVELAPRAGEDALRTEDVLRFIEERGHEVALFLMAGINYYTGQAFDIRAITRAARARGAVVGWDLAHAAGNVELHLHDDDVDFAAWCTYKYMNAGPGAVAMAFVHERHARAFDLPRFTGWWGNVPTTRFRMEKNDDLQLGAAGWQLSCPAVLSMAPLSASLALFQTATMPALRRKSMALTELLLQEIDAIVAKHPGALQVITPRAAEARGAQLSLRRRGDPERFLALLESRGVRADFRHPDVIRVAPAPLYCSYEDVWRFARILEDSLAHAG